VLGIDAAWMESGIRCEGMINNVSSNYSRSFAITAMKYPTIMLIIYEKYLTALDAKLPTGRIMPHNWSKLLDPLSIRWMAYSLMLSEFSRELANIINKLTNDIRRLEAWAEIVESLSDEDKMRANLEFINPLATVAVGLPYGICCVVEGRHQG
jgi:hypothetical protein